MASTASTQKNAIATAILNALKKLKITPKSCCLSAIMLCSIYIELFYRPVVTAFIVVVLETKLSSRNFSQKTNG